MIVIPGEKKKIREEIMKASENNKVLTNYERKKIVKQVHRQMKLRVVTAAILASLGISIGIGTGSRLIGDGNSEKNNIKTVEQDKSGKRDEFIKGVKVDTNELEDINELQNNEKNNIFEQIVDEYNSKYPDDKIQEENLGIIETEPDFLIKQKNNDNTIKYIQNYKTEGVEENQECVHDNDDVQIDKTYIVINKDNGTIILSQGMIDGQVVDIDSKVIRFNNKDYESNNTITLGESEADKVGIYNDLKRKFEERAQEKDMEK